MSSLYEINRVFLKSFDANELARVVKFSLDINIDEITTNENLKDTIFHLTTWAHRNGRLDQLVAAAKTSSDSPSLHELTPPVTKGKIKSSGLTANSSVGGTVDYRNDVDILEIRIKVIEDKMTEAHLSTQKELRRLNRAVAGEEGDDGLRWMARVNDERLNEMRKSQRVHNLMNGVFFTAIFVLYMLALFQ